MPRAVKRQFATNSSDETPSQIVDMLRARLKRNQPTAAVTTITVRAAGTMRRMRRA